MKRTPEGQANMFGPERVYLARTSEPGYLRAAEVSACGVYRYKLSRTWGTSANVVTWCMLNPSTADEQSEDQTSRKLVRFAERWGYDGLVIVNLFAFRSTEPRALLTSIDPVGHENDAAIEEAAVNAARLRDRGEGTGLVIAGWGTSHHATAALRDKLASRDEEVLSILSRYVDVHALRLTAAGVPHHPLYLPGESRPILYRSRQRA